MMVLEVWTPMTVGASIALPSHGGWQKQLAVDRAELLQKSQATFFQTTPSAYEALLKDQDFLRYLKRLPQGQLKLLTAGEKITQFMHDTILGMRPGVRLFNLYGPTEASIDCTCAEVGTLPVFELMRAREVVNKEHVEEITSKHLNCSPHQLVGWFQQRFRSSLYACEVEMFESLSFLGRPLDNYATLGNMPHARCACHGPGRQTQIAGARCPAVRLGRLPLVALELPAAT
eukprot:975970-Amphidinium_carterae.1